MVQHRDIWHPICLLRLILWIAFTKKAFIIGRSNSHFFQGSDAYSIHSTDSGEQWEFRALHVAQLQCWEDLWSKNMMRKPASLRQFFQKFGAFLDPALIFADVSSLFFLARFFLILFFLTFKAEPLCSSRPLWWVCSGTLFPGGSMAAWYAVSLESDCEVNRHLLKDLISQGLWTEEPWGDSWEIYGKILSAFKRRTKDKTNIQPFQILLI